MVTIEEDEWICEECGKPDHLCTCPMLGEREDYSEDDEEYNEKDTYSDMFPNGIDDGFDPMKDL